MGYLAQACSDAGIDPVLKSIRVAGSSNIEGKHVRLLERLVLPSSLDIEACPHCPKAGQVMICGIYSMLDSMNQSREQFQHAIVRDGEIGCEYCLLQCCLCNVYFCRSHLFELRVSKC